MTISFGPYNEQTVSMRIRRPPRIRASDSSNVFLLHHIPLIYQDASITLHAAMALHHLAPSIRMADKSNIFLLRREPQVALSGSVPIPTASVFVLTGASPRIRASASISYSATMHMHYQPRMIVADGTRFLLRHKPYVILYDGVPKTDRTAFLLQQPVLMSSISVGIKSSLQDQFTAHSTVNVDFIHALLDLIGLSDAYGRAAEILQALADGVSLSDIARMVLSANLLDNFIASAVPVGTAQITVMLVEKLQAHDNASAKSLILAALQDSFYASLTLSTGEDVYTAWVMTPESKAMRSYTNFPFNSYAMMDGQLYGASAAGIFRMGGPTDAGAAIQSAIRTGLLDFGTRRLKRIDKSYIGYTSDGTLALRVVATSNGGEKTEYTYAMTPNPAGSPRENRIPVGRGTKSMYWSFELINTGGSTFELFDVTVLPMVLTGRIS